ncbi:sialate O-acetylesterase [Arcticibacter pallidicorallinus]|uniref:Sialate O-acetylesterase n=1 Tax=Arcticibacter pallidicorallinus TaxID=1259464 RepID=A0A2T0UB31_9SPHI|nr:sialate O-acetylesterase [Arcticibacter pallidicorallinus]PRY55150.1 sialate O-acetylesterase [Arcticibacter pallidicorallinus]
MNRNKLFFLLSLNFFFLQSTFSQVTLPRLIRDSMVLQRDTKLKIWGWASPGEKVSIRFNGKSTSVIAASNGKWNAVLPAMKAGGPYVMNIKGKNTIQLKDILIGDVWLCAGQSNMVHQMSLHNITYASDIAEANYPEIRQFWVATTTSLTGPEKDYSSGSWKWANPTNVDDFSAVAYFFARQIYQKHRVPIGIINTSVGGTPIEAWTSEDGLKDFAEIAATITRNKDTSYVNERNRQAAASQRRPRTIVDKGLTGELKWYETNYVPKGWQRISVPGYWEDQGVRDLNGVVWYRREIDIPQEMTGVPAKIFLGRIVDADVVYVNGKQIGQTGYQYPQRRYSVAPGILKPGKNILVVRVQNNGGKGGFVPDKPYFVEANGKTVELTGYWHYKVGEVYTPVRRSNVEPISAQGQPTSLFNAMVAPATNFAIKGVLWYQGESNSGNATEYYKLLPALIKDYRQVFYQPSLPFLYVQLPNFGDANYLPTEGGWPILREAALQTLSVPNTAMAVTIDLGEWNDIHPDNKKDVGERLALAARKLVYNERHLVSSGPLFKSSRIDGNKIIIDFDHVGSGLVASDGEELSHFSISDDSKKFVWAKTRIEGNKVIVWAEGMNNPKYVRYAWSDNPAGANLYNSAGLPASPFRTDK